MCERMIGRVEVYDHKAKAMRLCRAGDIALLAPTGTNLWRYEAALEDRGIAVSTQAGKGLFRRQEIQDLIALTRVLADGRDTLAARVTSPGSPGGPDRRTTARHRLGSCRGPSLRPKAFLDSISRSILTP